MPHERRVPDGPSGDDTPPIAGFSSRGRRVRAAAQRRRASIARHRALAGPPRPPAAAPPRPRPADLSPAERRRRADRVAVALVRTIRSVPMPGVAPFSRRDQLLFAAIVLVEALVVALVVGAPHR